MRMIIWVVMLAVGATSVTPERALGQAAKATMGTAVGIAGGVVITMSVVVARARFQEIYIDSAEDLIHWQSAPMLITPAVGLLFGIAGSEPLKGSVIGSTSGLLIGSAIGAGVGLIASTSAEGPWAGGVIGAGIGMTAGGLYLGIRNWIRSREDGDGDGNADPARVELFKIQL